MASTLNVVAYSEIVHHRVEKIIFYWVTDSQLLWGTRTKFVWALVSKLHQTGSIDDFYLNKSSLTIVMS